MSLLFPAYLAGLLGLALPWLLHRFSNQTAPEQPFPSTRFLDAAPPPVSRTRQLRHRLLLLLRVLALLLLCFLFAQPWLDRSSSALAADRHHLVVLDRSLSMRTADRWPDALERASDIVDALPAGDTVELLGFDGGLQRTQRAEESLAAQWQIVQQWQPGFEAADYGVLMQGVDSLAAERDRPVVLWLITDIQKSALPARMNALHAPRLSQMMIESVAGPGEHNVHLQASASSDDGVNVVVTAQLRLSGALQDDSATTESLPPVNVRLQAQERLLAEQRVSLTPGELHTVRFEDLVLPPIERPVFIVSVDSEDDLVEDNRVEVVVNSVNPIPMSLLATEIGVSDNAAVFLSTSLQTDDRASVSLISGGAERLPAEAVHVVSGRDLSKAVDLDILQFTDSNANALLFNAAPGTVLSRGDAPLAGDVSGSAVGLTDDAHPLDLGSIDWSGVRFYDVPEMVLEDGDRVLLQSADRQPILVDRPLPRGRLLLLNDRLDGIGSNLPLQPAFVELMQSILNWFDASTAIPDQVVVGERLALPARVQVLDPQQEPLLSLDASAQPGALTLQEPGLHTVVGVRGEHILRVVLDAREADLSTLDDEAIGNWQGRHALQASESTSDADSEAGPETSPVATTERRLSLEQAATLPAWQWLLPLLLLAVVLETVLANRRLDVRRDGT